jgi:hypothetical protein
MFIPLRLRDIFNDNEALPSCCADKAGVSYSTAAAAASNSSSASN